MAFNYNNPIVYQLRSGQSGDSFQPYTNSLYKIVNNTVLLNELPVRLNKVQVQDTSTAPVTVYSEITSGVPTALQYLVDYVTGIITFNSAAEGKTLSFTYTGRGMAIIPSSRIWTQTDSNGNVTQTLDSVVSAAKQFVHTGAYDNTKIYYTYNLVSYQGSTYIYTATASSSGNVPTNLTYWRKVAGEANKGVYSTSVTYYMGDIVTDAVNQNMYWSLIDNNTNIPLTDTSKWQLLVSVTSVVNSANTATSNANTATTNANTATANANNAANLANNTANALSHKGTYSAATAYIPNNIVYYNGTSYMCVANTTGNAPNASSAYWKKLEGFNWQSTYSSANTYMYGDVVVDSIAQNLYISISDNNTNNTLSNTSYWKNIFDGSTAITTLNNTSASLAFLGSYSSTTAYIPNNMIYSNGATYMCIARSTGNAPPNLAYWKKISSLNWKNIYSTGTTYYYGDIVVDSLNQNAYFSIADNNINNALTNTSYWSLLVTTTNMISSLNNYQFLGTYNAATAYVVNNQVSYNGSTYICISNTTGNAPTNTSYWGLFAAAGSVGSVNSANADISVANPTTTPTLTLNSGVGANQIAKRDANGNIQNIGYAVTNISVNTNLTLAQSGIINVTTGTSNITVTLPDATTSQVVFTIRKADSGSGQVIINTTSAQTIDGVTNKTLISQYATITVVSSAGSWLVDVHNNLDKIGTLSNLTTTNKSNLASAVNEVTNSVDTNTVLFAQEILQVKRGVDTALAANVASTVLTYTGGLVTKIEEKDKSNIVLKTTNLTYDASGKVQKVTEVTGDASVTTTLAYDGSGNLLSAVRG